MIRTMNGLVLCIALLVMSATAQTVTGSGTVNTVPAFTGTSTLGNSPISASGSNVGIGTLTPSALLNINESAPSGTFDFYVGQPLSSLSGYVKNAPTLAKSAFVSLNDAAATSGSIITALNVVTQDNSTNGIWGMTSYASGINPSGTVNEFVGGLLGYAILESTGTVTEADGGAFGVGSTGGGTITNAYGVHLVGPYLWDAGGTIVNNYGLAIDDQTVGQANFAIKTGLGKVSFGDRVGIGTTNPGAVLEVNGTAKIDGALTIGYGGIVFPDGSIQSAAYSGANCSSNVPTASALAATPTVCTAPQVAIGIAANGNAICSQPSNAGGWTSGGSSLSVGYWVKDPTGHIHQWGSLSLTSDTADVTINFPTAYATASSVSVSIASQQPTGDSGYLTLVSSYTSASSFTVHQNNRTSQTLNWQADGY